MPITHITSDSKKPGQTTVVIQYHTGLGTANKFDDYIENINIKLNFALL